MEEVQQRRCGRVKIRNLELNVKISGSCLVSALLVCVCVCLGWGAGIKTGEMCSYTLNTISYMILNKAYFFPFQRVEFFRNII